MNKKKKTTNKMADLTRDAVDNVFESSENDCYRTIYQFQSIYSFILFNDISFRA